MEMRRPPIKPTIVVSFFLRFFICHILHFVFCVLFFVFQFLYLVFCRIISIHYGNEDAANQANEHGEFLSGILSFLYSLFCVSYSEFCIITIHRPW